jgi:deoxycytidylate deaminase
MSTETISQECTVAPSDGFADGNELVIAFVAAVGVNLAIAEEAVKRRLDLFGYVTEEVKITRNVLTKLDLAAAADFTNDYERIDRMMDIGTEARRQHGTDVLAKGIACEIAERRKKPGFTSRTAFLVHSLKHPEEVRKLRELYPRGFYLIGVHAHPVMRRDHLMNIRRMTESEAKLLMNRDKKEDVKFGQQVNDTFHLSDFFVGWGGDDDEAAVIQGTLGAWAGEPPEGDAWQNRSRVEASIYRFVDIIFGHPHKTPTFGEYAMFTAFTSSLRSADLSRQVGAVVAKDGEIISTGANDCPSAGGGLYWPSFNPKSGEILDANKGRDYMRGFDSNRSEQDRLIRKIVEEVQKAELDPALIEALRDVLGESPIRSLTEYGRVVHAEMEALLACARKGVSTKGATIYCTTFPCHNCAKHIIAAGIERVVFVEPYLKSKAFDFHKDAITISYPQNEGIDERGTRLSRDDRVKFEPFFGVGPRRFFDLFSMTLGVGFPITRKHNNGKAVDWSPEGKIPRLAMQASSYLQREQAAAEEFSRLAAIKN